MELSALSARINSVRQGIQEGFVKIVSGERGRQLRRINASRLGP
jgi:hypothetical protein